MLEKQETWLSEKRQGGRVKITNRIKHRPPSKIKKNGWIN